VIRNDAQNIIDESDARENPASGDAAAVHALCTDAWLKQQAEQVKIKLSSYNGEGPKPPAQWWCVSARGYNVTGSVSSDTFESVCDALFLRTMGPVSDALQRANVEALEIDEVVLVGGSSRLPKVRRLLQSTVLRSGLRNTVDPDLAVALGAALVND
jgi:molecular chaperone DnaK